MSSDERARWDQRYASGDYQPGTDHSALVEESANHLRSGRALVLACGAGRNAIYLAKRGFQVEAIDISSVAIEMARAESGRLGLEVDWLVADVSETDLAAESYDLITMIRYTNRAVWPRLVPALTTNGWLIMEQHLKTRHPVAGPSEEYRLAPGELLTAFPGLRVVKYYEEYRESETTGRMTATAGLLGCKGDPGW
jgi:SAM-dependent methyltransferase